MINQETGRTMKHIIAFIALFSASTLAFDDPAYQFYGNSFSMAVPNEAKQLTPKALNKRFGNKNAPPQYAFSNKERNVSFTVTQYASPANKKSMRKIQMQLSAMLHQANPKAKWKKDKTSNKFGTKVAIFEYETKAVGKYQYNITYALPVEDKLTLISFLITDKKYKNKWVELARTSFDSVQFN